MKFLLTDPDFISFNGLKYLTEACEQGDSNIWDILEAARKGEGNIYTASKGAVYIEFCDELMHIALFAADDLKTFKEEFWDFLMGLMKENNSEIMSVAGRRGWERIYPELKYHSTLYTYRGVT